MNNTELDELIAIGGKIISKFNTALEQNDELSEWKRECVVSSEIMLDYLKKEDKEKILVLSIVFQERYARSKPPAIPFWCRKISEYFLAKI